MPTFRYAVAVSTRDTLPAFSGSFVVSDAETVPSWLLSCSTGGAPSGSDIFGRWLSSLASLDALSTCPYHAALASHVAAPTPETLASVVRLSAERLGSASSSSKSPFFDIDETGPGYATLCVGTFEDAGSGGIIRSIVVTSASEEELPSLVPALRVIENSFPVGSNNF